MIKFFRKIRQKLLSENKFSKYLIYAFGEIILVVIGILIALQINNWNENRKLNSLEIGMLKEINFSLETDLKDLINEEKNLKAKLNSGKIIIGWIESNQGFNDSLSIPFIRMQHPIYFRYQAAPYETLKQLGLNTIKNDSVKNQIAELYDVEYDDYRAELEIIRNTHITMRELELEYFNEISVHRPNMRPLDIVGLRKDNKLLALIKSLKNADEYLLERRIPILKNKINQVKELIKEEIKSRS